MSRANNVRGPTSALTEFLRSQGITPTTVARRAATRQGGNQDQPAAGSSRTGGQGDNDDGDVDMEEQEEEQASPRRRTRRSTNNASGYNSDNLDDEPEEEPEPTPAKKRKLTKAAEAKLKAKEKEKEKAKKKKGKKGDDDDDYDEEEDTYNALSKMWSGGGAKPPVGSFEDCAKCEKQFTVTKYTMACIPGPGYLCHPCAKASGSDPFKKPAAPKRKKAPADKRSIINFEEKRFPTLVSLCIQLITKHIDDVEAFGDIGTVNMDSISKALSKSRALTAQNAPLFYNTENSQLTFYDATNLDGPAFESLTYLNPNLTTIRLDYCGQLNDTAMAVFTSSLPALTSIELLGPFLVRVPAWNAFLAAHPNLTTFRITQSPRFDLSCIETLADASGETLVSLRLKEVGKLDDAMLGVIGTKFTNLEELDISEPAESCTQSVMIKVLEEIGSKLKLLDVSNHILLDNGFLEQGIKPNMENLQSLSLSHLPELTDKGVANFFSEWSNTPLVSLTMSRNPELNSEALMAILHHSGKKLEELNINGWKEVGEKALHFVGKLAPELHTIDVSWCREVDDFVVKDWLQGDGKAIAGCMKLKELRVWGCNKITTSCPRKPGVNIIGVETQGL